MSQRTTLRLAAGLLLGGFLAYLVATILHTGGPANDHPVIFDDYAGSHDWTLDHLGQFVGMAVLIFGLIALRGFFGGRGAGGVLARLGATAAAIALGLYAVLQAVDGVALKQAVDAWVAAAPGDRAVRFANAETMRWLEWGTRSYHNLTLAAAYLLIGLAVLASRRLPRLLGVFVIASGVFAAAQGWEVGTQGFSDDTSLTIVAGYAVTFVWTLWLAVLAWRGSGSVEVEAAEFAA